MSPSGFGSLRSRRVAEAVEDRPDLSAWFVSNRAANHRGNIDSREARAAIERHCEAVPLADLMFTIGSAFDVLRCLGRTVEEYEPVDPRAIREMEQLYLLAFGDDHDNAA